MMVAVAIAFFVLAAIGLLLFLIGFAQRHPGAMGALFLVGFALAGRIVYDTAIKPPTTSAPQSTARIISVVPAPH